MLSSSMFSLAALNPERGTTNRLRESWERYLSKFSQDRIERGFVVPELEHSREDFMLITAKEMNRSADIRVYAISPCNTSA